jgi:hypothetical protein
MTRTVVNPIDLSNLAGGAIAERFNVELAKVLENIADPNTDPKQARSLTVKLTFKADEERDIANVSIETKTALASAKKLETKFVLDRDYLGNVVGAELIKSSHKDQIVIENPQETNDSRVVGFNKIQGGNK